MTEINVYKSDFLSVAYVPEEQCVYAKWMSGMISLPLEAFKTEIKSFLIPLKQYKVRAFLVNSLNATYPLTANVVEWIFANIIKALEQGGVEKLGIVYPIDYMTRVAVEKNFRKFSSMLDKMQVRVFEEIDEAKKWLLQ